MKSILFILVITLASFAQSLVAKDSNGLVIEIKEKYGGFVTDTCTAVMLMNGNFIIVHREGVAGYFPESFHSVRIVGRVENRQTLAGRFKDEPSVVPEYADLLEQDNGIRN
jgi:hypothetical protein